MTAALEADSLYRFFHAGDDETLALRGVSLGVDAGEIVAVTGPVGLRASRRCWPASPASTNPTAARSASTASGSRAARRRSAPALRARRIGMLFQHANLVGHLSVADNVALAQRLARRPGWRQRRDDVLERCGHRRRAPTPARASSPAASSRAPGSRWRWPTTRR